MVGRDGRMSGNVARIMRHSEAGELLCVLREGILKMFTPQSCLNR